uniref:Uncharacterized protein n=1 Tax=Siphoviridae sp. ctoNj20 TaxID=2826085 RepID=A0A8D9PDS9_9CAUD|nr:MAG TPA: hypothetical protein [Siphoviridae sp. ctoNj20]
MNLELLGAVVQGYTDRVQDQELLAVQSGYWSGYWSNSKHPKSLKQVVDLITRNRKPQHQQHSNDVDVETFLEMERKFNERRDSLAR